MSNKLKKTKTKYSDIDDSSFTKCGTVFECNDLLF